MKKILFVLLAAVASANVWAVIRVAGTIAVEGDTRTIAEWSQNPDYGEYFPENHDRLASISEMLIMEGVEIKSDMTLTLLGDTTQGTESLFAPAVFTLTGEGYTVIGSPIYIKDGAQLTIKSGKFEGVFNVEAGSLLTIEGGSFKNDPSAYVDKSKYNIRTAGGYHIVEEGGGPTPVSEPEGVISNRIEVLDAVRTLTTDFNAGYKLSFSANAETLAEYGTSTVGLSVSFTNAVAAGKAVFGINTGSGWVVTTNQTALAADEVVQLLVPAPTLNDVIDSDIQFAIGGDDAALRGNLAEFKATLSGKKSIDLATASRYFNHGFYGPSAPEGEALPITGKDVVGYFKFDDKVNLGANVGVTASKLTGFSGAAFSAASRRGGAITLASADSRVTGTLVSGIKGRALPEIPITMTRPTSATRPKGDTAWTIAFWYRPDSSAKPAVWDSPLVQSNLSSDWANLFDGCWHHIAITFNPRDWIETLNPMHVYCDGGHWQGIAGVRDDGWKSSWWGDNSQLSLPIKIDKKTEAISLGGSIVLQAGDYAGQSVEIPLVGTLDDLIIFNRWCAPDDIHGLYQTGDTYVYQVVPDIISTNGVLNAYKNLLPVMGAIGGGQLWTNNCARGSFDSHYGWSTYYPGHAHWQTDASRDYDESGNAGYNVAFCDYLVDLGADAEFITAGYKHLSTFPGASLTLGRIGGSAGNMYLRRGAGEGTTVTIEDLRLNKGYIKAWSAKDMKLVGAVTVNGDFAIVPDSAKTNRLTLATSLAGESDVTLTVGDATENAKLKVALTGDASEYEGLLAVTNATLAMSGAALALPGAIEVAADAVLELPVTVWSEEDENAAEIANLTNSAGVVGAGLVRVRVNAMNDLALGEFDLAYLPYNEDVAWTVEVANIPAKKNGRLGYPIVVTNGDVIVVSLKVKGDMRVEVEGEGGESSWTKRYGSTLKMIEPEDGYTAKWWDGSGYTLDRAPTYRQPGTYTNGVWIVHPDYNDYYTNHVFKITGKQLNSMVIIVQ